MDRDRVEFRISTREKAVAPTGEFLKNLAIINENEVLLGRGRGGLGKDAIGRQVRDAIAKSLYESTPGYREADRKAMADSVRVAMSASSTGVTATISSDNDFLYMRETGKNPAGQVSFTKGTGNARRDIVSDKYIIPTKAKALAIPFRKFAGAPQFADALKEMQLMVGTILRQPFGGQSFTEQTSYYYDSPFDPVSNDITDGGGKPVKEAVKFTQYAKIARRPWIEAGANFAAGVIADNVVESLLARMNVIQGNFA